MLLIASGLLLLYAGRHLTFFYDEWSFVFTRRGGGIGTYLDPHNGHLVLFPVVAYKFLFSIFGLRHYTPYRAVEIALHLLCGALLYVLVRPRLGPWLALIPIILLMLMGTAWQNLLWPFQMAYLASIAGGLGALVMLKRRDGPGDAFAAGLLVWSVSSSGVGIPFLVACAVALSAQPGTSRRLWIVAVPAVLYLAWYLGWGSGEHVTSDAILGAPQYVATAAAGAVDGIAGLGAGWGPPLTVALVMGIGFALHRGHRYVSPVLLASAVGVLTFWVLAAVTRADSPDPTASRYLYVGAVFIVLIAAEAGLGTGLHRAWVAPAGILVVAAIVSNLGALRDGERGLRNIDASVRASLAAVEIASPVASPAFLPEPVNAPQITAGPYLAAIQDLGSPALTLPELERASESIQRRSDAVLEHAEQLAVKGMSPPITGTRPVSVTTVAGGRVTTSGLCERWQPHAGGAYLDVAVPVGAKLLLRSAPGLGPSIYLRRFAADFGPPLFAHVAGGVSAAIRFPLDRASDLLWHVRLTAPRSLNVCVS